MNTFPPQPESKAPLQESPVTLLSIVEVGSSSIPTNKPLSTKLSWGEQLLPFLFAAMETCWIDATLAGLASMNLLGVGQPLIPLWSPFVLIAGFYTLTRAVSTYGSKSLTRLLLVSLIIVVSFSIVWASVYASRLFLFDPSWLLNLPIALAQVDAKSFQILTVIAIAWTLCRRGIQLAQNRINPLQVSRVIRFGAIVIVALIVAQAIAVNFSKTFSDDTPIVLLIALFFCLSLIAHALARISFVRYSHPTGLAGSVARQERVVIQVILGSSVAFFLFALFTGNFLTSVLSWFSWPFLSANGPYKLMYCFNNKQCKSPPPPAHESAHSIPPAHSTVNPLPHYLPAPVAALLSILLLALLFATIGVLVFLLVRGWRKHRRQRHSEIHESLWSWLLFWTQFKGLLRTIRVRFLLRFPWLRALLSKHILIEEEENVTPAANNIREIYRAVLARAAKLGHPRSHNETPYEFRSRLAQQLPFVEPQLSSITEAYTLTRYGGLISDEFEVAHLRQLLMTLEQKGLK